MAMSPDEQALYKSIVANLPFTRHQQGGVIAGYAVAAVIALYGLTRDKIKPNLVEILIWFVVAGSICGLLLDPQNSAWHCVTAPGLPAGRQAHLSAEQIKTFGLSYRLPFLRDLDFVLCLIAAIAGSAGVAIYLWLHPWSLLVLLPEICRPYGGRER